MQCPRCRATRLRNGFLAVALGASLAGCGVEPVLISLPSAAIAPVPEQGRRVSVMVSDERSEKSPARLGILQANKDFMLAGEVLLATRLEDELVTALRTRGYRADHARDALPSFEVSVRVRVVRFAADVPALGKPRFHGRSVLVVDASASDTPASSSAEVIDTRVDTALGDSEGVEGMRKLAEQLFQKAAADLADRLSVGLPPSPSGL